MGSIPWHGASLMNKDGNEYKRIGSKYARKVLRAGVSHVLLTFEDTDHSTELAEMWYGNIWLAKSLHPKDMLSHDDRSAYIPEDIVDVWIIYKQSGGFAGLTFEEFYNRVSRG